jgi:hypothetical protein
MRAVRRGRTSSLWPFATSTGALMFAFHGFVEIFFQSDSRPFYLSSLNPISRNFLSSPLSLSSSFTAKALGRSW